MSLEETIKGAEKSRAEKLREEALNKEPVVIEAQELRDFKYHTLLISRLAAMDESTLEEAKEIVEQMLDSQGALIQIRKNLFNDLSEGMLESVDEMEALGLSFNIDEDGGAYFVDNRQRADTELKRLMDN